MSDKIYDNANAIHTRNLSSLQRALASVLWRLSTFIRARKSAPQSTGHSNSSSREGVGLLRLVAAQMKGINDRLL